MTTVAIIVALTAFLFALQHTVRRTNRWLLWLAYGVIPAALAAHWVSNNDFGPFVWIKLISVLFCVCYGTAVRDTALGKRSWGRSVLTVLLALNILEAVVLDCLGGTLAHALNAVAGLALVAALPRTLDVSRIVADAHVRDIQFRGVSFQWIIGYSVWNWTFVYLNYPEFAGHHIAVLLSCVLVGAIDSRLWLQARACTLGAHLMLMVTFPELIRSGLDTSSWSDPVVGLFAAFVALGVAGSALRPRLAPVTPVLAAA